MADMDNEGKGIAWVGSIFHTLEAMFLEVDDIMRQMIGTNVKQLHSDLLQEVIPESSLDTADGSAYDSSLVQNIDEVYVDGDHFEKEACTVGEVYSCPGKYYKVSQYDLSLEETFNAGITENHSEEMQFNLEKSDSVILDNKDPSLAVLSPASNELLESNSSVKIVPALVPPSGSVKMLHSCGSKVYYGKFSSGGCPTELVGTSDNSIDDITNKASSHKMNLDESCVIVDNGELIYVSLSHDVGRHRSCKKKFKSFATKWTAAGKQDPDQHAALYRNPDLGSCKQKREVSVSFSDTKSNHEFFESDWEII